MKKNITCVAAASCLALSANLALAEGGQGMEAGHNDATTHLDRRFQAADANHDGGLDRQEAVNMPMLSKYFDEVDANKDGKVTRQEYFNAMPLLHGVKNIDTSAKPQSM
jgi:hypothetical protein